VADHREEVRKAILGMLMSKVQEDKYPSVTMMDMIESLLGPDEMGAYADILMEKIRGDRFPSVPMMKRLLAVAA
jgi:hypothetical protein